MKKNSSSSRLHSTLQLNKTEHFWDKLAKDIDLEKDQPGKEQNKAVKDIQKYIKKTDIVLDYGCARGGISLNLAAKVKRILGIDISSKMIAIAKKRAAAHKIKNVDFEHAQIFDKKFKPRSFNVIIVLNVIHLVIVPDKVITQLYELLKPGGIVIFETPCLGQVKSILSLITIPLLYITVKLKLVPFISFFKINQFKNMLTEKKLKIIESKNIVELFSASQFVIAKK